MLEQVCVEDRYCCLALSLATYSLVHPMSGGGEQVCVEDGVVLEIPASAMSDPVTDPVHRPARHARALNLPTQPCLHTTCLRAPF